MQYEPTADELLAAIAEDARPGDVVACMSSGSFGGLPRLILAALQGVPAGRS